MMKTTNPIRLNLGCGRDYKKGYINVDIVEDFPVDVLADLSKPLPFKNNYADEVFASDILEHFTKEDGEVFLKECHRILKVRGKLIIRTHNIIQIIKQFKDDTWVMKHFIYGNTEHTGVWGAHKYAYGKEELEKLLKYIGFISITIEIEQTNFFVTAVKEKEKSKKLTIGIIQHTPGFGGAETNMINLVKYLNNNGNHILHATNLTYLSTSMKPYVMGESRIPYLLDVIGDWKGLVKTIAVFPLAVIYYLRLLSSWKNKQVDCLLMSGFSEKMLVSVLSLLFDIPVFWIEYADLRPVFTRNVRLPEILYRLCNGIPKSVIVPGEYTKQQLMRYGKVPLSKLVCIPPGVVMSPGHTPKKTKEFVIGNISRLVPEKGQEYLIRAMTQVIKKIPTAKLLIAGEGMDPKIYQDLIKKLHLENHVKLLGFVPDIHAFYKKLDIFVFPTVWQLEGFGMVATEAMAAHVPVIASDLGTIPEILDYGNAGMLVPPGNPEKIAENIIHLYQDKKLRNTLGKLGHERVKNKFSVAVTGQKFLTHFQKELA